MNAMKQGTLCMGPTLRHTVPHSVGFVPLAITIRPERELHICSRCNSILCLSYIIQIFENYNFDQIMFTSKQTPRTNTHVYSCHFWRHYIDLHFLKVYLNPNHTTTRLTPKPNYCPKLCLFPIGDMTLVWDVSPKVVWSTCHIYPNNCTCVVKYHYKWLRKYDFSCFGLTDPLTGLLVGEETLLQDQLQGRKGAQLNQ